MPRRRALALSGLTLIELLVGIALLAIVMALAAPGFEAQVATSQLSSASNALMGSLMEARSQAMRLGRRVTVCRSRNLQQCDTGIARGWESGWLTFIDDQRAGDVQARVSAGDTILHRSEPLPRALRVHGNGQLTQYISFAANGEARTMSGGVLPLGTIRVCHVSRALDDRRRARDLVLAAAGRVVSRLPAASVNAACPAP